MTHIDVSNFGPNTQFELGPVNGVFDRFFDHMKGVGQCYYIGVDSETAASKKTPTEQRLAEIQKEVSSFSMHLPEEFAPGLGRQFANMLDKDAWEEEDDLPSLIALRAFLNILKATGATRRPGIGTNGRGSITAFWRSNENRLTIDCLPSGELAWSLSSTNDVGGREHAAVDCSPARLLDVLAPYNPRSWFDQ